MPADRTLAMQLLAAKEHYNLEDDNLLVHVALSHPKKGRALLQWVVPMALRALVLRLLHDQTCAGHSGVGATHTKAFERFYWPGMAADIRTYVTSCLECQANKSARTSRYKVHPMPPQRMWQRGHMDLLKVGVTSADGHEYILTIVEARSGFVWVLALRTKNSTEVAQHLFDVCMEHGCLFEEIVSDQGTEFAAAIVADLCLLLAIHRVQTSGYHPQSNGVAESANHQIIVAERGWVSARQTNWHKGLKALQLALRTRPRGETGLTPFFCLYGREARLPYAMLNPDERPMNLVSEVEEQLDLMRLAERVVDEAMGARVQAIERRNEQVKRTLQVEVGDWVYVRRPPANGRAHKIDSHQYTGPWQVMAKAGDSGLAFTCRMMGSRVKTKAVHVEHMKPYHHRPLQLTLADTIPLVRLTPQQLAALPPGEALERIVDRRAAGTGKATWQYRIARVDGSVSDWIPEATMLKLFPSWVLDSFHAHYELRHNHNMPIYAKRPEPVAPRRRSVDEALAIFPRGTPVVRAEQPSGGPLQFIWGAITGYLHPYWRARYDDGEWEELNHSEARAAIEQAKSLRARAAASGDTASKPQLQYVTLPRLPADFGAPYVGDLIRLHSEGAGWAKGQITAYTRKQGDHFHLRVQWQGTAGDAPVRLREGYYTINPRDVNQPPVMPRNQAWNLLVARPPPATESDADDSAPARAVEPATADSAAVAAGQTQ
jgi:transposase InsO family protein